MIAKHLCYNRIAQIGEESTGYFLDDALGSVRQVADEEAEIVLAKEYSPRECCAPERLLREGQQLSKPRGLCAPVLEECELFRIDSKDQLNSK